VSCRPGRRKGAAQARTSESASPSSIPSPASRVAVSTAGIPTKTLREDHLSLRLGQSATGVPPGERARLVALLMARKSGSRIMNQAVERNLVRHGIERIRGSRVLLPDRRVEREARGERVVLEPTSCCPPRGRDPGIRWYSHGRIPMCTDSESILRSKGAPESISSSGRSLGCEYASNLRRARRAGDRGMPAAICCRRSMSRWRGSSPILQLHGTFA